MVVIFLWEIFSFWNVTILPVMTFNIIVHASKGNAYFLLFALLQCEIYKLECENEKKNIFLA